MLTASGTIVFLPVNGESRTIVVPDDYPTIAAAVGNATDGYTILVRKGTYDGPWNQTLMINKTISLIGEDAENTKIIFHPAWFSEWYFATPLSGYYPSMVIDAEDVVIAGFTILTDGWAIKVNGNRAQVIGNIITTHFEMRGSHQTVAYNTITSLYYPNGTVKSYAHIDLHGSYCTATANTLVDGNICTYGSYNSIFRNNGGSLGAGGDGTHNLIYGNSLKDSGGIGIAATEIIVANNTITNSTSGGVYIGWGGDNIVFGNTITNCPAPGLSETDNSWSTLFYANYVANNRWGAKIVSQQSNTTLYHNNFVNNVNQVHCGTSETVTPLSGPSFTRRLTHWGYFDNGTEGNYWSDYNGTDANFDGVGDTPYVIDEDRSDHYPLMAPVDVSNVTLRLPDWANLTIPSPLKTPSFPPKLKPLPTPHSSPPQTPSTEPEQKPSPLQTPLQPEPTPFPTPLVAAASTASIVMVGGVLLLYFKKRKH